MRKMNEQQYILLFGRLGKNPELKYTKEQKAVCAFSLAQNLEGQDKPIWHNIIIWGKQAEQCNLYLKKGSPVFVRGQIQSRSYTSSQGETKQFTEVKADLVGFTY